MSSFGENLRREREMRGITLHEIADSTKISVRFLEAVETEQFSKLPGGIFARSFIRSYAGYLGLDEERVMAEFHLAAPPQEEADFSRIGVTGSTANHKSRPPVLPWIIAIILLAGGYGIFRYAHRTSEEPLTFGNPSSATADPASGAAQTPTSTPQSAVANPAPGSAQSGTPPVLAAFAPTGAFPDATQTSDPAARQVAGARNIKPVAATGRIIASPALPAASSTISLAKAEAQGEMVLQVAATQPAWIAVDADGKTVLEHVLTPHEVQTLVAKDYFDVTTGNAQGTVLTLDGVTLKPLGQYGEVKKVHLTRDDLKNHTP
ncbi:MAG TPA: RodZ domain-containing protein [Terriglobia bacterium]|nr:RodZ domain-containing protein [Terriglobia bacterium]